MFWEGSLFRLKFQVNFVNWYDNERWKLKSSSNKDKIQYVSKILFFEISILEIDSLKLAGEDQPDTLMLYWVKCTMQCVELNML